LLGRTGLAWGVFALLLVLLVWALPLHRFLTTAILVVLAAAGFELMRRQVAREAALEPASAPSLPSLPWQKGPAPAPAPTQVEELERLARLKADGLLTDEEFAAAKGQALGPAS
jgi:uncharacterized membrane protein YraQ (UPF0718 family)